MLILGLASLALGVLGFIFASRDFSFDAPSGTVTGTTFLGIEGNGWTWVAFAAAGLLLLLGSPIHWGAKSMAFIVGVVMVVGALISLSDGNDILGIFATNNWTTLVMGAGGVAAILISMMPRVGTRRGGAPVAVREEPVGERRFERRETVEPVEPVADDRSTVAPRHARRSSLDRRAAGEEYPAARYRHPLRLSWVRNSMRSSTNSGRVSSLARGLPASRIVV